MLDPCTAGIALLNGVTGALDTFGSQVRCCSVAMLWPPGAPATRAVLPAW